MSTPLTYGSYLRISELLALQTPQSEAPEHDEMLFIVIHQVYELWFKQLLHEVAFLQTNLEAANMYTVMHTLRRLCTLLKTLVSQVDILETMTPLSFASFRGRLQSSSGFQSAQFRLLEFAMGHKQPELLNRDFFTPQERIRLEEQLHRKSVYHSFLIGLEKQGVTLPHKIHDLHFQQAAVAPCDELQACLLKVYQTRQDLIALCERLVDVDEGFQEWRYRHVKMVERTIGSKQGTGGSSGIDYLKRTLFKPFFPDLWLIRSEL